MQKSEPHGLFSALSDAGEVSAGQVRQVLEPAAYLGATGAFLAAALAAHDERDSRGDEDT